MAIIKCKMCGGNLVLVEGQSVAECEYCGSKQTVPAADNEKKLNLFASANKLRAACEFDRAAGVYDAIKAEFPSEAEAYWGLVLCKYGIEYVDDPATGKKVPTCHRLSFDSVMDDSNLDMAMDCADAVARKVYREEAKHLEKIRTGILEVSSNEKPYDIFICYKENDENGDRTLDSVLAQDLYAALTEKGYRVFFSRITLQSKLGEAYEPYIFAALNSARVMLAIGTDPEYYSAVWVKNEWSRYLKICAEDKSKHLIPCYRDMDAYDMPKEFRPLQGVDLGKIGAVQDILFNMEKYIPLKKQNTTVIQEKVVVGGTGGSNKIASLLDRGNMALEDGDWAKADSFFEDVLNNDSKNAQAYIGKTLAQERCRTMDALVRKRRDVYQNISSEKLYIQEKSVHIGQIVEQYSLTNYVGQGSIRNLYQFDLSYSSEVSGRQKQYHEEEIWWQNHKQLSRAEKFAVGAVAEHLQREKKHLFAQLADRVKKAQEADARSVAKLEASYDAHIAEADKRAEKLYNNGLAQREKDYENWLEQAKTEISPDKLKKLADNFTNLRAYKDSENLAEHCCKRAAEEQAKIDVENERLRVAVEQKKKAQQKREKWITTIAVVCMVLTLAVILVVTKMIIPGHTYKEAEKLLASGEIYAAATTFDEIGDYKNSRNRSFELWGEITSRETVSVSTRYTMGLHSDGTVVAVGWNGNDQCNVNNWMDIVAVSAGPGHTVGLKADGTVVARGYNEHGQCDIRDWADIVAISAGRRHTVGLCSDGRVVAVGDNNYGQCNISDWTDIVSINAGDYYTVGLKADGTVVAVGDNSNGQCNISRWKDIVAISTGVDHTVGLCNNGAVVSSEDDDEVSGWSNIVSISAGEHYTVGLKADGTVVAVGDNNNDQCNVSDWTNIVAISAGGHTVGLKADGTVVAVGKNEDGQCEVSGWENIKLPTISEEKQVAMDAAKQERETQLAAEQKAEDERLAKEYAAAEELAKNGEMAKAAIVFYKLDNYQDARERCFGLWDAVTMRETVSAGYHNTIALKTDGTAVATEHIRESFDYGQCEVFEWTDLVTISAGTAHTIGLKADGTVVATEYTGKNDYGQREVSDWTGIVSVSAGSYHTVGLRADGTVIAVGSNSSNQCEVTDWTDIVAISAGGGHSVGLKADGSVRVTEYTGEFNFGQCEVSDWKDIVAISAGSYHTVGLKSDGTVVAVGNNKYGQCEVNGWTDIVAISVGTYHTVGLKADGTVVAVGFDEYGRCNVSAWRDIVAISAGNLHTVGLKSNGTMVAVGGSNDGQCDVSGWKNVKLPK